MGKEADKEANSGSVELFHLLDLRPSSHLSYLTKQAVEETHQKGSDFILLSEFVDLRDLDALIY